MNTSKKISVPLIDALWSVYFWSMTGGLTVLCTFFSFIFYLIDLLFRLQGRLAYRGFPLLCKLIIRCSGVSIDIRGKEYLRPGVPKIIVANHQSHFDFLFLGTLFSEPFKFISKKEHGTVPFFGWILRMAQYLMVDRDNPGQSMQILRKAGKALDCGFSIVVFPEGTRTPDGEVKAFKSGPFYMAIKKKVPVLPIRLCGFRAVLPKNSLRFRPGRVSVIIGEPVYPIDKTVKDKKAFADEVRETILNLS